MGRFARIHPVELERAIASAGCDDGRKPMDIYRNGIVGILEPKTVKIETIRYYVQKERTRRRGAFLTAAAKAPDLSSGVIEVARHELSRIEKELRKGSDRHKLDLERYDGLLKALDRVSQIAKRHENGNKDGGRTKPPKAASKSNGNGNATLASKLSGDVHSDAGAELLNSPAMRELVSEGAQ